MNHRFFRICLVVLLSLVSFAAPWAQAASNAECIGVGAESAELLGMCRPLALSNDNCALYAPDQLSDAPIVGDVNGDGIVDAEDYRRVVGIILGRDGFTSEEEHRADVNGDGMVNICDASIISDIVCGKYSGDTFTGTPRTSGVITLSHGGYIIPKRGEDDFISVYLNDSYSVRDLQFFLTLPESISLTGVSCKYEGYTAVFNRTEGNAYQVIISSQTGEVMKDVTNKEICTLQLTAADAFHPQVSMMTITNFVYTTTRGISGIPNDFSIPLIFVNGDVNKDDYVNGDDLARLLDVIIGRYSPTPDELQLFDVNGDGRIDILDATTIGTIYRGSHLDLMFGGATDTDATVTVDAIGKVAAGSTISVRVNLKDTRDVRDMQFKVHVAEGVTLTGVLYPGTFNKEFNRTGNGEYQVAIASRMASAMKNGTITLQLAIDKISDTQIPVMTITDFLHTHSDGVTTYPAIEYFGDVNSDFIVNAEDYRREIDIILERGNTTPDELLRADLNGEGHVNVDDVTYLSDLVRGVKRGSSTTKSDVASIVFSTGYSSGIDVKDNSLVDVPICINIITTMRDMQFKVRLPEGVELIGAMPSYGRYEIDFNRLSDGAYRVILHSLDGATIVNNSITQVCSLRLSVGDLPASNYDLIVEELMLTPQNKELWWSSKTFKTILRVKNYPNPKIETDPFFERRAGELTSKGVSISVRRDIRDFQIDMELPYGTQMERVESMIDGYSVTWQDVTENADNTEKDCSTFRFVVEPTGDAVFASLNDYTWTKYNIINAFFTLPHKTAKEEFYLKNGTANIPNGKKVDMAEFPFSVKLIPMVGDINGNGTIDADDYPGVIDLILGRRDSSVDVKLYADLNGDRKVNIGDASMLSDMIRSLDVSKWIEGYADKTGRLSLSFEGYAIAGTTKELGLILNDSRDVRDIQFTLNLPVGLSLAGVNATYEGYTAEFNRTSERDYLVVVHSLKGATMGDAANKQFCTLMLATDDAVEKGDLWFTIKDFVDTHPDGGISTIIETIAWVHAVNPKANADVNYDGIVDAEDFNREIDIILGRGDSAADSALGDLNGDRKVNVGDATLLSDMIRGVDIADMLMGKTDNTGALSAPTYYTLPGKVISIPVYLSDERAVRDVQFKVSVPKGFSLTSVDCKYAGYTAEFNRRSGQAYQIVIYSLEGATMADVASKEVCTLQFAVDNSIEAIDYTMTFSGIVDSHPDGVESYPYDSAAGISVVKQMDAGDITDGSEVEDDGSCYKPLEEVGESQIRPGEQYVLASINMQDEQAGYLNGMTLCNQETLPKSCLYTFESAGRNSKGEPAYYIKNAAGHYFTKPGYVVGYTSNVLAAWKVTVKELQMWLDPDYEYCWYNPETDEEEDLVGADAHIAEYREMGEPLDLSSATYCWSGMIIADAEPHDPADPYSTYTYLLGCSGDAQNGTVARGTDYGRNAWRIYTVREWDDDSLNPDINRDGIADEQDFRREIDFILGRETSSGNKRADINRDGSVNVGDVTILSELLRGYDVDDMLRAGTGGRGTVSYDDVSVLMGEAVEVPLYLQYNYKVRDIQFRVTVPGDVRVTGIKCNYDGYTADYHYLGNQNYQVVVSSLKGTMMSDATKKQICTLQLSTDMVHEAYNRTLVIKDFMFTNFTGEVCTAYDVAKAFNVAGPTFIIDDLVEGVVGEVVSVPLTLVATHDVRSIEAELWGLPIDMTIESEDYVIDGYSITWTELPRVEDADTKDYKLAIQPKGDAFLPAGQNYKLANFVFRLPDRIITTGLAFGNIAVTLTDGTLIEVPFKSVSLVVKGHPYELTLDFKKGWNWFSTNIEDCPELTGKSYAQIFDEGVTYVANQTEAMIRDAEDGTWFGGVRPNLNIGFKAYAEQDVDYHFTGTPVYCEGRRITLYPGWTWIPYLPSVPMMVSEAFQYQGDSGDVIKSLQSSATCYAGKWLGDFMMYPGQGYLYYSTRNRTSIHTYPSASVTYYQSPARISEPTYDGGYFDFNCHQSRDNMAIIARIADADAHRYVVGAFHGEECCGKSVADQGYHIITAHGEGGDRLKFVILDTMTDTFYEALDGVGAPLTITFNGTLAGTPDSPVVLSIGARIGDVVTGIRFKGNDADDNADVYHLDGRRAVGAGEGIIVKRGRKSFVK